MMRSHGWTGTRDLRSSAPVDVGNQDQRTSLCIETADDGRTYPGGSARDEGDLSREAMGF
jgi:hypothetical protein